MDNNSYRNNNENKQTNNMAIDDNYIKNALDEGSKLSEQQISEILEKADKLKGLTPTEVAGLLNVKDKKTLDKIFEIAGKIKKEIYGDRVVMFAPLYISDYCVNKCEYCSFSYDNDFQRKKLNRQELIDEVVALEKMGHKRLALEFGEDNTNASIDYIVECIKTIYGVKFESGEIRRANVNIAATTVEDYKKLKEVEIGTYILFQETYHKETYERIHIAGPKKNFENHLTAFDRAMDAGIEDVGGGVLFGFYDYKFEVLGLMLHNQHLENKYGVGFHTISVPRLKKAVGSENDKYEYILTDEEFIKLVAILRLAVPYTGLIVSTRETAEMRRNLINKGISQISSGSSVEVGGYSKRAKNVSQFELEDGRSHEEILDWLLSENLVPSFCTACYRQGRVGDRFMELAKTGDIKNVCLPNGLLTLKEYSLDYGDENLVSRVNEMIKTRLDDIENEKVRKLTVEYLDKMDNGERDLFL